MEINQININEHIGQVIHTYRKIRELTLADLAQKLDISYQQLQKYEKGTNRISADKLFKIAEILKANPVEFFPGYSPISYFEEKQKQKISIAVNGITDKKLKASLADFLHRMNFLITEPPSNYPTQNQ